MIQKIDHLGLAVRSLEQAIQFYETAFGLKCERIEEVPSEKVRIAFLPVGDVCIELLEPTSEESSVARFLAQHGEGFHHIAFATEDVQAQADQATSAGCKLTNPKPSLGAGEKRISFVHPKTAHGVLIELCGPQ